MLLVDDDQPQILERQEQRRTRAGDDPHLPLSRLRARPFRACAARVGMPFGRLGPEAILETFEESRRQRDFRQQDQHLLARRSVSAIASK